MQRLTTAIFFSSALPFAGIHLLAERFFLYDVIRWLDIPMHFFGGIIVALALFAAAENGLRLPVDSVRFVVAAVVVIAVGWEVFEWFAKTMNMDAYVVDTATDLVLGTLGGYVGYQLGQRFSAL
jgi:hypothetical protein